MTDPSPLHLFFTMECERVVPGGMAAVGTGGPESWEYCEDATRRFDEILAGEGFVATYFITPDTAVAQSAMWLELAERGNELGLHLHAQMFGDGRWDRYVGEYDDDSRAELFGDAVGVWRSALGRRPRVFRAGNFSGDASLFPSLLQAGLIGGSASLPGRNRLEFHAKWAGFGRTCQFFPADADRTDAFLEIPVSASGSRFIGDEDNRDPLHLRVESHSMDNDLFREVVAENLDLPLVDPTVSRTLCVMTHNTPDYTSAEMEQRLRDLIGIIRQCANERGFAVRSTTIEDLRRKMLDARSFGAR